MFDDSKGPPYKRPIVFGSKSHVIKPEDPQPLDPSHSHRWTVYLKGLHDEDISYFIDKVEIRLHDSFVPPTRVFRNPPYQVTETGWGEFMIHITIWFIDRGEKPITLDHMLQLHHKPELQAQVQPMPPTLNNTNAAMGKGDERVYVHSEQYEEIEFHNVNRDLSDALLAHPWRGLEKSDKDEGMFGRSKEEEERVFLTAKLEKLLQEGELIKQSIPMLEQELRTAYDDLRF